MLFRQFCVCKQFMISLKVVGSTVATVNCLLKTTFYSSNPQ